MAESIREGFKVIKEVGLGIAEEVRSGNRYEARFYGKGYITGDDTAGCLAENADAKGGKRLYFDDLFPPDLQRQEVEYRIIIEARKVERPDFSNGGDTFGDILRERGYACSFEKYTEGLPEESATEDGYRVIRSGPIPWWSDVRHPMGEKRRIQIGGILFFDPNRFELQIEQVVSPQEHATLSDLRMQEGRKVAYSAFDRVVSIRELLPK